jgi:DNA polymerase
MLDVFASGRDIYKDFATRLFGKPYEEITKAERNYAKPGILGACYQLGAGEEIITPDGVRMKTGLLGYAAMLGVEFTQEQSTEAIRVYRTEYKEIVNFWYDLERAAISVVKSGGTQTVGYITFDCVSLLRGEYKVLRAQLPSGRHLHYIDPQIEESEFSANGKTFKKDVVTYMGVDQQTRQWVSILGAAI